MIEAIFFDLDGTLKVSLPEGLEMFLEYAHRLGIVVDDAQARAGARWNHWYWAQSEALLADLAATDEVTFWVRYSRRLLGAVGATGVTDAQARLLTEQFADYAPQMRPNDGALETLAGLRAMGLTLALVSNRSQPLDQVVSELGFEGLFDLTLAAGEIGIWKPDPAIFDEALARCQCRAEHTIYVGDNYYADVVSARAAHLVPVLIDPDGIFEATDCKVIGRLTELLDWLVLDPLTGQVEIGGD